MVRDVLGWNIVVTPHLTKYKIKGRPAWMYFDWVPLRCVRNLLVSHYRNRWVDTPGHKVVIRNIKSYRIGHNLLVDRLTFNELMNSTPLK